MWVCGSRGKNIEEPMWTARSAEQSTAARIEGYTGQGRRTVRSISLPAGSWCVWVRF